MIVDNFITTDEIQELQRLIKSPAWKWGQVSNNNTLYPMWFQGFCSNYKYSEDTPQVIKTIAQRFVDMYPGSRLFRAMLAGNTYGQDGDIHRDWHQPGHKTMVVYCNDEWDIHWGGETIIYNDDLSVQNTVHPVPGRATIFESDKPHIGKDPSRRCGKLRVILAIQIEVNANEVA